MAPARRGEGVRGGGEGWAERVNCETVTISLAPFVPFLSVGLVRYFVFLNVILSDVAKVKT